MTSQGQRGSVPCVEQPALEAFDKDGDGIVSFDELRALLPSNQRLQDVVAALEEQGIVGIKYTGCGDSVTEGPSAAANGSNEDLASLIARAAVARIYENQGE